MLDIVKIEDGEDLMVLNSLAPKAANVISVQVGTLEYASDFGSDLAYFFQSDLEFQNQSFKSYLVSRLVQHQVNVSQVIEVINTLYNRLIWFVGESQSGSGILSEDLFIEDYFLLDTDGTELLTEAEENFIIKVSR